VEILSGSGDDLFIDEPAESRVAGFGIIEVIVQIIIMEGDDPACSYETIPILPVVRDSL
jgi:hypothetical protein